MSEEDEGESWGWIESSEDSTQYQRRIAQVEEQLRRSKLVKVTSVSFCACPHNFGSWGIRGLQANTMKIWCRRASTWDTSAVLLMPSIPSFCGVL